MSIKLTPGACRLTVLGSGWSNSPVESGNGLTNEGNLFEQIGGILGYDPGPNVNWDDIGGGNVDWEGVLYEGENGNFYEAESGNGSSGSKATWVTKEQLITASNKLTEVALNDKQYAIYGIPNSVLKTLYGGKVSKEDIVITPGSERPHRYAPSVYYIQRTATQATIFLDEPFYHSTNDGGLVTVYDKAITIRQDSAKAVYYSSCDTIFSTDPLPEKYRSIPIEYICWQCLHGSFSDVLVSSNNNTITTEMIQAGTAKYETMTVNGKTYYKLIR